MVGEAAPSARRTGIRESDPPPAASAEYRSKPWDGPRPAGDGVIGAGDGAGVCRRHGAPSAPTLGILAKPPRCCRLITSRTTSARGGRPRRSRGSVAHVAERSTASIAAPPSGKDGTPPAMTCRESEPLLPSSLLAARRPRTGYVETYEENLGTGVRARFPGRSTWREEKESVAALRKGELTGLCDDVDLDRDRALVERSQAGDAAAFGNLYARYYGRLLRFCMRRLSDRHEAEDATQEAFARAWKALPRFAGDKHFYPWLTVIAGNICTDVLRGRFRSSTLPPSDGAELVGERPGWMIGDASEGSGPGRGRRRAGQPGARPPVGAAPQRAGDARRIGLDVPTDSGPRGGRDRHRRDAVVAGPSGTQARVRRPGRVEGCAGRFFGGHGLPVPPGALPRRPPRRRHAAAVRRLGRSGRPQRACRCRRGGCGGGRRIRRAARSHGQRQQRGGRCTGRYATDRTAASGPGAGIGRVRCSRRS